MTRSSHHNDAPPAGNSGENAATALDAYQDTVLHAPTLTHRDSPLLADILLRALLRDLGAYADRRGLDFDAELTRLQSLRGSDNAGQRTSARRYEVGAEVRVRTYATVNGPRSSLPIKRGFVTAVHPSHTGRRDAECSVRFPGVPTADLRLPASALGPTVAFPHTMIRTAIVTSAADAEKTLVTVAARIVRDLKSGTTPATDDMADRSQLADALADWAGCTRHRVLFSLDPQISTAAFQMGDPPPPLPSAAQLAADDFPHDLLDGGVPATTLARRTAANPPSSAPQPHTGARPPKPA